MNRTSNWNLAIQIVSQLSLPVFPCREMNSEYKTSGKARKLYAKAPYTRNGFKDATLDLGLIDQFWSAHPNAIVGVPMGKASGLIAIDIDEGGNKCGEETFAALKLGNPLTVQTRTLSGGRHLFFRCSETLEIRNDTSTVFGKDIDVRGEGGYVIWAGSKAAEGGYAYIPGFSPVDVSFAEIPENFLKCFTSKTKCSSNTYGKEGNRNNDLFSAAVKQVHACANDAQVRDFALKANQEFKPPLPFDEVTSVVRSASSYRSNAQYPCTDLGNAERLKRDHKGSIIYVPEMKSWLCYSDGVWTPNLANISQRMHETVRNIVNEGDGSIEAQDILLRWSKRSEANARIKAGLEIASNLKDIVTPISDLDADGDLLNLANGTYNTRTMTFSEHKAPDLLTSKARATFDAFAYAERWNQFIFEVTGGSREDEDYLKKFCGYLLLSDRKEQIILFLIGDGGDGKSVFIETIKYVLGNYQTTLSSDSISISNRNSIPNDIAKLRGKRLVTVSELPKDMKVDSQLVKGISGGDTLTARFLHQEYFDFDPKAQLLIATNFYPYANPEDKAYFRRVAIMRFPVCFTDKNPDKHLASELRCEAEGIITWMIEGLCLYLDQGLTETESMRLEKLQYERYVNPMVLFFEQYLTVTNDERDFVTSDDMDRHLQFFQEREDGRQIQRIEMREFLQKKGYQRKQKRFGKETIRGFVGLKLKHFRDDDLSF